MKSLIRSYKAWRKKRNCDHEWESECFDEPMSAAMILKGSWPETCAKCDSMRFVKPFTDEVVWDGKEKYLQARVLVYPNQYTSYYRMKVLDTAGNLLGTITRDGEFRDLGQGVYNRDIVNGEIRCREETSKEVFRLDNGKVVHQDQVGFKKVEQLDSIVYEWEQQNNTHRDE